MERPLVVGWVASPRKWEKWPEVEALLTPAAKQGYFDEVLEPDELLWVVLDGGELLACATCWLGDGFLEVKLVGGRDHPRWLANLDQELGREARAAGAARLIAWGRRGWTKVLRRHGWEVSEMNDGTTAYSRALGD